MTVVSDDGLLLPSTTRPFLVEIDGHYVWSLTPERDGVRQGAEVLVPWPGVLRPYLSGRGRVRVADTTGDQVLYDDEAVLGDGEGNLAVVDRAGNRLCVDKVGHLTRSFEATAETVREEILAGTQRAVNDLLVHGGVNAYLNYGALLGAFREGRMLAHDSDTDLCYLSDHRLAGRHHRRVLPDHPGHAGPGLEPAAHVGWGHQVCCCRSPTAAPATSTSSWPSTSRAPSSRLGNRSGDLPRSAIEPFSTIESARLLLPGAARPGGDAGLPLRPRLAHARPLLPLRRPRRRRTTPRRLAARLPQRDGPVDRLPQRPWCPRGRHRAVGVRTLGRAPGPVTSA
ncbi:hypothetical protein G5V59_26400 [Nocardioides sp. W3-2-3]|uniref:hypothetical protein n=1 Tax=Nocardioides convexus TaxID=2712224 RepID=UPI0024186F6A|nr:hypothetical protein [Nocardioides convexus]NHA01962.1 hypothetical protein [Nocardioides convexus]